MAETVDIDAIVFRAEARPSCWTIKVAGLNLEFTISPDQDPIEAVEGAIGAHLGVEPGRVQVDLRSTF